MGGVRVRVRVRVRISRRAATVGGVRVRVRVRVGAAVALTRARTRWMPPMDARRRSKVEGTGPRAERTCERCATELSDKVRVTS